MSDDSNTLFKPLNDKEKTSKLLQIVNNKVDNTVTVWLKGTTDKVAFEAKRLSKIKSELTVSGKIPDHFINQELLYTFELSGVHFFGKGKLSVSDKAVAVIDCKGEVFKSERRRNFRLLTHPHHQVYININVGKEAIDNSNVLSLNTGMSQTSLFKNFLEVIGDKTKIMEDIEGYLRFRVLDISATGLAFLFGNIEKQFFEEMQVKLGPVFLDFNNQLIRIPDAKVLYTLEKKTSNQKVDLFKGGMQFLDVDTNLDQELASIINATLRSAESEFEDFIK